MGTTSLKQMILGLGPILCALSLVSSATVAQPGPPSLYEPPPPTSESPIAVHYPGGVIQLPQVTYKTITGYRPLKLDLYLPPKTSTAPKPLIVWIHGGGFEMGNPQADWTYGDWTKVLARLAARGYVVAGVSYRLSGEARFPAQIDDVDDAVRFLRLHASQWGVDTSRVYAWGLSAGGTLAELLGTKSATSDPTVRVQGVISWFGASDLSPLADSPPITKFLG